MSPAVAGEALLCENVTVYAPKTLGELVEYLWGIARWLLPSGGKRRNLS